MTSYKRNEKKTNKVCIVRVMFIDGSNPMVYEHVRTFAELVANDGISVVLVSDKEPSSSRDNFEVINLRDVPQSRDMAYFQGRYNFSLYKALIPERAFFDYSSFSECQKYSALSEDEIEGKVLPYVNAFDYIIQQKVDVVIESLADTFKTSLAGNIANFYGKNIYMSYLYYWWSDGCFFLDRLNQTSSRIDSRYRELMSKPDKLDVAFLNEFYAKKRVGFVRSDNRVFPIYQRLVQLLHRRKSYDPISLTHWVCRRIQMRFSRLAVNVAIKRCDCAQAGEKYLIYPLHVTPEAVLIGGSPEIADQFSLIKNISMNLPYGVKLYVKEHPDQVIGIGLDYDFYRRLASLPNVRIVRASASLAAMLDSPDCMGVVVIGGTTGLEAAMKRKAVFVFGNAIYGAADCFIKPKDFDDFFFQVKCIVDGKFVFNETALYAMLQALNECVVRGSIDYSACKTTWEMHVASQHIGRNFLLELKGEKLEECIP